MYSDPKSGRTSPLTLARLPAEHMWLFLDLKWLLSLFSQRREVKVIELRHCVFLAANMQLECIQSARNTAICNMDLLHRTEYLSQIWHPVT